VKLVVRLAPQGQVGGGVLAAEGEGLDVVELDLVCMRPL
jgi:hypothetical protein